MKLKQILKKIKELLSRKKVTVKDIEKHSKKKVLDMLSLKEYLSKLECPNCKHKNSLLLINYEVGNKGWETKIGCKDCNSRGILNNTGITFTFNVNKLLKEEV